MRSLVNNARVHQAGMQSSITDGASMMLDDLRHGLEVLGKEHHECLCEKDLDMGECPPQQIARRRVGERRVVETLQTNHMECHGLVSILKSAHQGLPKECDVYQTNWTAIQHGSDNTDHSIDTSGSNASVSVVKPCFSPCPKNKMRSRVKPVKIC